MIYTIAKININNISKRYSIIYKMLLFFKNNIKIPKMIIDTISIIEKFKKKTNFKNR